MKNREVIDALVRIQAESASKNDADALEYAIRFLHDMPDSIDNPTIAYLRQASRATTRMRALDEQIARARALGSRAVANYGALGVQEGGGESRIEAAATKAVDLERQLVDERDALAALLIEIRGYIAKLGDIRERDILTWRYINDWPWTRVISKMAMSERHVYRLHGYALIELERIRNAPDGEPVPKRRPHRLGGRY